MSKFLCKAILFWGFRVRTLAPAIGVCVLRNPNVGPLRWLSNRSKKQSFTVSYLKDSLGFSAEAALSASKLVAFETSEKPDKVISLFKKYGFTEAQISCIFKLRPTLLMADSEKTILPKLEFFRAKGFSWPEFAKRVSVYPTIFHSSLDQQIIPTYEFFRDFFHTDEKVIMAIKRYPVILVYHVDKHVKPKIAILREHGIPDKNIATLFQSNPNLALMLSSDRLRKLVGEVAEMGFNRSRHNFVAAVSVLASMSKSTWESKVNAYKKWGWSEEDVSRAFGKNPFCMKLSLDNIAASMNFYINKMGFNPLHIANQPIALSYSLKKRLIPRSLVFQALRSKGMIEKEVALHMLYRHSEKKFLEEFVVPYQEEAPELLKLFKENSNLSSRPGVENV